ncbi:MAG TPA: GtrA family protein [Candidatus Saccharimonadales bacterium]|nr:GtrA family protein [Candidatus Saccharimonadales bacterium]
MGIKQTETGWRSNQLMIQFAEYMVGGGVWFWGGLAVFAICFDALHWPWWVSKVLADGFGWSANYGIQRYWAFYSSKLKGQNRRVIFRYVLINGIDFIFDYIIIWAFIRRGITPYIGFFVSSAFTTVWDYLWYRFWVFKPAN